jgi:hypothetical protein
MDPQPGDIWRYGDPDVNCVFWLVERVSVAWVPITNVVSLDVDARLLITIHFKRDKINYRANDIGTVQPISLGAVPRSPQWIRVSTEAERQERQWILSADHT